MRALPCPAGAASRREAGQPGAAGAGRALDQAVGPHRAGPVADGELQATHRHRESALAVCRLRRKRCILLFILPARLQRYSTSGNLALRAENTDLILQAAALSCGGSKPCFRPALAQTLGPVPSGGALFPFGGQHLLLLGGLFPSCSSLCRNPLAQ